MDFQNLQKSNFVEANFWKIRLSINLPWGHVMSHKKFGLDRFSRCDVYWIQIDKQTDKQSILIEDTHLVFKCILKG